MADPSSTAAVAVSATAGMGVVVMGGVDGNALIGAFAGAVFFVAFARDPSFWASVGYLVASWVFGYFAAGEIIRLGWMHSEGFAAFVGAVLCVVMCTGALDWLKGGKPPLWLRFILNRGGNPDV